MKYTSIINFLNDIPDNQNFSFSRTMKSLYLKYQLQVFVENDDENNKSDYNVPLSVPSTNKVAQSKGSKKWTKNYKDVSKDGKTIGKEGMLYVKK